VPHYTYPAAGTLKNKLGTTDSQDLGRIEGQLVAARIYELTLGYGPNGQFDTDHLKAVHRHLYQDIYEWAGHTRDEPVGLSDGTVATEPDMDNQEGLAFLPGHLISRSLDSLFKKLREAGDLRGLPRPEFASRAADILSVLTVIHPFRHGNGPALRAFVSELAEQAGHTLDFTVVSKERMRQAAMAANDHDDPAVMRCLFDEISDPSRVDALRQAIVWLEQRGFPWNDRHIATLEPGQPVELTMVSLAGDHFVGRTGSRILIGKISDLPRPHPRSLDTFTIIPGGQPKMRAGET